jgi:transposase
MACKGAVSKVPFAIIVSMKINLTDQEKIMLKALHRQLKTKSDSDKIKAILMLSDGHSQKEVSKVLLIDEDTVSSYKQKYQESQHFTDWLANEYKGYKGKLSVAEEQAVSDFVIKNTITDSKQVQVFIVEKFGKIFSIRGVIALLHRLGFTYKKTTLMPSKYDAQKQEQFKQAYEKLEAELPANEVIAFMDGVHPQHNTTCTNAWIKVGQTKIIKSNTGRSRINLNGIYNPLNQDILIHESDTINAETTIDFLKKIEEHYQNKTKIHIIVDNARYYKNKEVTSFLANSKIELMFLPPYSPNLNLIERLWKYMRKKVINNEYYESFKVFRDEILKFFENCKNTREAIRQFIGTKLHLLPQC